MAISPRVPNDKLVLPLVFTGTSAFRAGDATCGTRTLALLALRTRKHNADIVGSFILYRNPGCHKTLVQYHGN